MDAIIGVLFMLIPMLAGIYFLRLLGRIATAVEKIADKFENKDE